MLEETVKDTERVILSLIDNELYNEAVDLFFKLAETDFTVMSGIDTQSFFYRDLYEYAIGNLTRSEIGIPIIYSVYKSKRGKKRVEEILEILELLFYTSFKLEDLMQYGDELEDFDQFLSTVVDSLGDVPGETEKRLLTEVIALKNDSDFALEEALSHANTHPGLFLDLLENENLEASDRLKLSKMALESIAPGLEVRERVAEHFVGAANDTGESDTLEEALFTSFETKPTPLKYLRALSHSKEPEKIRERLNGFINTLSENSPLFEREWFTSNEEERKSTISEDDLTVLKFLSGDFNPVKEKLNSDYRIGWTYRFIKESLALMLMFYEPDLYDNHTVRSFLKEAMGLSESSENLELEPEESIPESFKIWREGIPFDKKEALKETKGLEELLKKRVESIMENNRRNYYGECAGFIEALGRVKESLGERGARRNLIESYKRAYPRRRNFIKALNALE